MCVVQYKLGYSPFYFNKSWYSLIEKKIVVTFSQILMTLQTVVIDFDWERRNAFPLPSFWECL